MAIYFRDDTKANAREVRAYTDIASPPWHVFSVVTDFDNYPKFMPYTKEEKILEHLSPSQFLVYSVITPPATAWRDSVSAITFTKGTPENGGVFKSEWEARPTAAPTRPGVVRIPLNQGYWLLEPIDAGRRTRVTYEILTNPGGNIPRFIVDSGATIGIPDLFNAVRRRAAGKGD
jgi:hypothetical protein